MNKIDFVSKYNKMDLERELTERGSGKAAWDPTGKSSPQNFYRRGTGTSFHRPISNGRTLHHWNIRPTKNLNYQ